MDRLFKLLRGIYCIFLVYLIGVICVVREFWRDHFVNRDGKIIRNYILTSKAFQDHFTPFNGNRPVAVVTGGSGAIGFEIVKLLLSLGYRVITISRELGRLTELPSALVYPILADLSIMNEAYSAAVIVETFTDAINLVICNAGVMLYPFKLTSESYETHMALHLLGHATLLEYIRPLMDQTDSPRIVFVSSATAYAGDASFSGNGKQEIFAGYLNGYHAYATSKLAVCVYAKELARVLLNEAETRNIVVPDVCSVHPGCVPSPLYRFTFMPIRLLITGILSPFMRTPSLAAAEVVATALRENLNSGYYYDGMVGHEWVKYVPQETRERLYLEVQMALSGAADHGLSRNVTASVF